MKKVSGGRMYDTDTAKELGYCEHGQMGSFDYCCETLYRTKSGMYFIHGEGGAKTKYAKRDGDNLWMSGESIKPIPEEAARKWAEQELSGDEYEAAFGDVVEDTVQISATIKSELKDKFDAIKRERGLTTAGLISDLIEKA